MKTSPLQVLTPPFAFNRQPAISDNAHLTLTARGQTLGSVCRHQFLKTKIYPHTVIVKIFLMVMHP